MAISKFENYLCDIEDENKSAINKLIRKVATEAYNNAVTDSKEAITSVSHSATRQADECMQSVLTELYVR